MDSPASDEKVSVDTTRDTPESIRTKGTHSDHPGRFFREFLWIGLGQIAAVSGAIVGVRLLTGALAPSAYGEVALAMTVVALSQQAITGPLANGAARFFAPAREAGDVRGYVEGVKGLLVRVTVGFVLMALAICLGLVVIGQSRWIGIGLIVFSLAIPQGYSTVLNKVQTAARQRVIVALHQGLASWGRCFLALGAIALLGASSTAALVGYLCAMLMVLISQWVFFRRTIYNESKTSDPKPGEGHRWKGRILSYSWPFTTFGIFTWAHLASDRWSLQMFATTKEVGVYAVLYQLGYYPITVATDLLRQWVSPILFERAGDASDARRLSQVHKVNRWLFQGTFLLVCVATVIVAGIHKPLFRLLVAGEYRSVSWLLPGMVLAAGLFAAGQLASLSLISEIKTKPLLCPKVVTALVGIGLNILGAKYYGIKGVTGANIVFSGLYFLWMYLIAYRRWKTVSAS